MSPSSSSDSSFLFWTLGLVIVVLTAHVVIGWVRQAQAAERLGGRLFALAAAGVALGIGWNLAIALGLTGESFAFPLGFGRWWVLGLWLGSTVATMVVLAWVGTRVSLLSTAAGGVLLAALVTAMQAGWILAAGFRPGVTWRHEFLALAFVVQAIGFGTALTLAFPQAEKHRGRIAWRLAAAVLTGFVATAGEALVVMGARLQSQMGSLYRGDVSATMFCLVGGAVVPFLLILMAVDLEMRRRARRHQRRHRVRRPGPSDAAAGTTGGGTPAA